MPAGCLLREITGWSLVQVAGWRDSLVGLEVGLARACGTSLPGEVGGVARRGPLSLIRTGPGRLWIVDEEGRAEERLAASIASSDGCLTPLSHGRCRWRPGRAEGAGRPGQSDRARPRRACAGAWARGTNRAAQRARPSASPRRRLVRPLPAAELRAQLGRLAQRRSARVRSPPLNSGSSPIRHRCWRSGRVWPRVRPHDGAARPELHHPRPMARIARLRVAPRPMPVAPGAARPSVALAGAVATDGTMEEAAGRLLVAPGAEQGIDPAAASCKALGPAIQGDVAADATGLDCCGAIVAPGAGTKPEARWPGAPGARRG